MTTDDGRATHGAVLAGATLIDGTGAPPQPDSSVVVVGEQIAWVGPRERLPEWARGMRSIDLRGHTVLPGFIDTHVHLAMPGRGHLRAEDYLHRPAGLAPYEMAVRMRRTIEAGVTTVRDLGGADLATKVAVETGLTAGPRLSIAINVLTPTGGVADFRTRGGFDFGPAMSPSRTSRQVDGVDDCVRAVRELRAAGADVIKVTLSASPTATHPDAGGLSTAELAAVTETARSLGLPVAAHANTPRSIVAALEAGARSIEHGYFVDDRGIELLTEQGAYLVPTLSTFARPVRDDATPEEREQHEQRDVRQRESFARLLQAGGSVAMGTDAAVPAHGANLDELRLMVDYGMTPMQAIVAGTGAAARLLELDHLLGTVATGRAADLVVADVDPIADIASLAEPAHVRLVIKAGVVYSDRGVLASGMLPEFSPAV